MNYAGFWRRFAALFIDGVIVFLISMILIIPFWVQPLGFIVAIFYHVVFEVSPLRATPGKALMGIAVVKSNGSKLTIKDSVIRFVISILSSAILCIGYLMNLFTEKRQTLHDFVADTVVIEEKFAEHNFWQIFLEQSKIIFASANSNSYQGSESSYNNGHPDIEVKATPAQSHERPVSSASLEELYNLHQKGILTDEEYKAKKEEYLKRL
ncbi:MAG: RDD family protein [Rhizobacter sp.]|nr:RDD family protein [Bacteriovorax sp.]